MVTPVDLANSYARPGSAKRLRTVNGDRVRMDPLHVNIVRGVLAAGPHYGFNDGISDRGIISEAGASTLLTAMEALFFYDHKDVKTNGVWQYLYHQDTRQVPFMTAGGAIANGPIAGLVTYPCHYCGIILPEELIQVDHHKPQAYPGLSVLKLFHSFTTPAGVQLTTQMAHGHKNTQINAILGLHGGLTRVPVKARIFGAAWGEKAHTANLTARYSLTDTGKTVLTLIEMHYGGGTAHKLALNNLLNLVPACPKCNNAKRARRHAT